VFTHSICASTKQQVFRRSADEFSTSTSPSQIREGLYDLVFDECQLGEYAVCPPVRSNVLHVDV